MIWVDNNKEKMIIVIKRIMTIILVNNFEKTKNSLFKKLNLNYYLFLKISCLN